MREGDRALCKVNFFIIYNMEARLSKKTSVEQILDAGLYEKWNLSKNIF